MNRTPFLGPQHSAAQQDPNSEKLPPFLSHETNSLGAETSLRPSPSAEPLGVVPLRRRGL